MAKIIIEWNELLLEAIRRTKPGPRVARSIAIVYTSIYDAWAAYETVGIQSRANFNAGVPNKPENATTYISFAAYRSLAVQFSTVKYLLDDKMSRLGLDISQTFNNLATLWGKGTKASKDVLNFRKNDRANEVGIYADTTDYVPGDNPIRTFFATTAEEIETMYKWQPLTYLGEKIELAIPSYKAPHWAIVKPFSLSSTDQCRPSFSKPLTSQGFFNQAKHGVGT